MKKLITAVALCVGVSVPAMGGEHLPTQYFQSAQKCYIDTKIGLFANECQDAAEYADELQKIINAQANIGVSAFTKNDQILISLGTRYWTKAMQKYKGF